MFLTAKGKKIHYTIKGSGQPLLLVHGWGGSIKSLEPIQQLASKDFKAITLDLPGFGQSENPNKDWGTKEYSLVIADLVKQLGFKNLAYFGHSFGGNIGIYLAASRAELIDRMILCSTSFKREQRESPAVRKAKKIFKNYDQLKSHFSLPRKLFYRLFYPQSDMVRFAHLETNYRKVIKEDLTPFLKKIKQPTLILWGDLDQATPIDNAYILDKKIGNSQLKIYQGFGHNLPLIASDKIYKEIAKFCHN